MSALFQPPGPDNPATRKPFPPSAQWRPPSSADDPFAASGRRPLQPTGGNNLYSRLDASKPETFDSPDPPDEANAKLAQLLPPSVFFARPPVVFPRQLTPLEDLPPGSAGGPGAGKAFPRKLNKQQPKDVPCIYCRTPTTEEPGSNKFNGDHVIPRIQGGSNDPTNHVPACQTCNLQKGGRTPAQWYEQMRLQDLKS